jgi:hypothetical protein
MSSRRTLFDTTWDIAQKAVLPVEFSELRRLCASRSASERLLGLMLIRRQIDRAGRRLFYFHLAVPLIEDPNNYCRWQALIIAGEFILLHRQLIWKLVRKYGASRDEDMRSGVAVILLEELLQFHYDWSIRRVKREIIRQGKRFEHTLSLCARFGQARLAFRGREPWEVAWRRARIADEKGMYRATGLAPGRYDLFATNNPPPGDIYMDDILEINRTPDALGKILRARSRGKQVEVGSNGNVSVSLAPIDLN